MAKNDEFVMVLGKSSIGGVCWPITRFYIVLELNFPTLKHVFWVHTLPLFSRSVKTPFSPLLMVAEGEHHFFRELEILPVWRESTISAAHAKGRACPGDARSESEMCVHPDALP